MHYEIKVYRQYININVESGHFFHVLAPYNRIVKKALFVERSNVPNFEIGALGRLLYYVCELSRAKIFEFEGSPVDVSCL